MTGNDIVPSSNEPEHTAIIPAPGGDVVPQDNKNDPDYILVGEVITDAEVVNETKKRKPVEFLAPPQDAAKKDDALQPEAKENSSSKKWAWGIGTAAVSGMLAYTFFNSSPPAKTAPTIATQSALSTASILNKFPVPNITIPTPPTYAAATSVQEAEKFLVMPYGPVFENSSPKAAKDTNNIRIAADSSGKRVLLAPLDAIARLPDKDMSDLFNAAARAPIGSYIQPANILLGRNNPATLVLPLGPWERVLPQMQIIHIVRTGDQENRIKHANGEHKHLFIHADANQNFTNGVAWELCGKNIGKDNKGCTLDPENLATLNLDIELK